MSPPIGSFGSAPARSVFNSTSVWHRNVCHSLIRAPTVCILSLLPLTACNAQETSVPPVVVPFEFVSNQILIDVVLPDGTSAPMVLDTGVFPSVVDLSVAEQLGLQTSKTAGSIAGLGSRSIPYRKGTLSTVALGGFVVRNLPIIVTETTHIRVSETRSLLGTLGESFFRRATVEIDYPARVVRLWPASASPRSAGASLGADVSGVTPRFSFSVNGVETSGWLDTGASGGLVLSESSARSFHLEDALAEARTVQAIGTRGPFEAKLIEVDSVRVAGMMVYGVTALVMPSGPTWVGNDVWRDFRLFLDYKGRRVTLVRPPDYVRR